MNKLSAITLLVFCTILTTSSISFARDKFVENKNEIYLGHDLGQDIKYSYLGIVRAINGDINGDSFLFKADGGFGEYNYATPAGTNNNIDGKVSDVDAMLGYQKFWKNNNSAKFFIGYNYQDHEFDQNDPGNSLSNEQSKDGVRVQGEFKLSLLNKVTLENISNYSSVFNSYYIRSGILYDLGSFAVGPQVTQLGNRVFNQQRFGLAISRIHLGLASFDLSSGYMKSAGLAGDDGLYGTISLSTQF
jgi:hypothetical protein